MVNIMKTELYKLTWKTEEKCDCDFTFGVWIPREQKHLNCHAKILPDKRIRIYILWEIVQEGHSLQDMAGYKAVDRINYADYNIRNSYEYEISKGFPIRLFSETWGNTFDFVWVKDTETHK